VTGTVNTVQRRQVVNSPSRSDAVVESPSLHYYSEIDDVDEDQPSSTALNEHLQTQVSNDVAN